MSTEKIVAAVEGLGSKLGSLEQRLGAIESRPATDNGMSLAGIGGAPAAPAPGNVPASQRSNLTRAAMRRDLVGVALPRAEETRELSIQTGAILLAVAMSQRSGRRYEDVATILERDFNLKRTGEVMHEHLHTYGLVGGPNSQTRANGMQAQLLADGGALIPEVLADAIIEELRPVSAIAQLPLTRIDMPAGNISMSRVNTGTSGSWAGETESVSITKPALGLVRLGAKRLVTVIVESNQLIQFAGARAAEVISGNLIRGMAQSLDSTAIRSLGTQAEPAGLRGLMASGQKVTAVNSTAPSLAQVDSDIFQIIGKVQDANQKPTKQNAFFLMSGRTERYLMQLRDGTGLYPYGAEMAERGTVKGYKYISTENIPNTLGGSSNGSEIYFGVASEVVEGKSGDMAIKFFEDATYDDGGTIRSGINRDESAWRSTLLVDYNLRHTTAWAMLETVKWGAV
jgi:HK97 family phage major capsid protein